MIIGLLMNGIIDGFIFGQMSGMINALRENETEVTLNDEDISWIGKNLCVLN